MKATANLYICVYVYGMLVPVAAGRNATGGIAVRPVYTTRAMLLIREEI